jgi:hypothetical protein
MTADATTTTAGEPLRVSGDGDGRHRRGDAIIRRMDPLPLFIAFLAVNLFLIIGISWYGTTGSRAR